MPRKRIPRPRRQELMCEALRYAGTLVREVVNTYEAFEDLPEDERTFIDEYIVSIGDRLHAQGEQRDPNNQKTARRIAARLERS